MIRFDSVTKTYPGQSRPALNDVGVEILRGEFVFLVGASGSGKSSFLRLILKEEKPSKGRIHVLGQDLGSISSRKVPYFRRDLGVVFQDFRLLPNKNVYENVAFTLRVIGKSRGFIQSTVPETLKLVGLDGKGKRMPHELSGGEQQRVAIARAIVNKPADPPRRRADRKPRPGHQRRHHDPARAHQRERHDGGHGHPRGRHRRPDAAPRHRALGRRRRARRAQRGLRRRPRRRGRGAHRRCRGARQHRCGDRRARSTEVPADEDADAVVAAVAATAATAAKPAKAKPAKAPAKPVKAAAPKVGRKMMDEKQPLYVEPEERDEVTDAAAAITAAATAAVPVAPAGGAAESTAESADAAPASKPGAGASEHLTLAERLGLRAPGGPREGDDEQEVGPTR